MQPARRSHTAHRLHTATVWYQCHPFYGTEVEVIRHLRKSESAILIVRLPGGSQIALPDWMMMPEVCDRFTNEAEPRIAIDALFDLRRLIDSHSIGKTHRDHSCAESPSGGKSAQQGKSVRLATQAALRQRGDLDRASGIGKGTMPDAMAPNSLKCDQDRRPRRAE